VNSHLIVIMVLTVRELNKSTSKIPHIIFLFVVYVLIGVSYFHFIRDHFSFLDSLYFAVVTFTTVGYGEFVPKTNASKLFTCFFILLGLILIGYFMVIMGEIIIDNDQRMRAMHRTRILTFMDKISAIRISAFNHIKKKLFPPASTGSANTEYDTSAVSVVNGTSRLQSAKAMDKEVVLPYDTVEMSEQDEDMSVEHVKRIHLQSFDDDFEQLRRNAISSAFLVLILLVVGSVVMHFVEGWHAVDSFYWACVTITTVGYGDIAPETSAGKGFTIIYCVVGCVLMTVAWTELVKFPIAMRYKRNERTVMNQFDEHLSAASLSRISDSEFFETNPRLKATPKDETSKIEFVVGLLHMMGKISNKDILMACRTFDRLDLDSDGLIRNAEIALTLRDCEQSIDDSSASVRGEETSLRARFVTPIQRLVRYLFTGKSDDTVIRRQDFVRLNEDEELHDIASETSSISEVSNVLHSDRQHSGTVELGRTVQPILTPNIMISGKDPPAY